MLDDASSEVDMRLTGWTLLKQRIRAFFAKRMIYSKRKWVLLLTQVFRQVFYFILPLLLSSSYSSFIIIFIFIIINVFIFIFIIILIFVFICITFSFHYSSPFRLCLFVCFYLVIKVVLNYNSNTRRINTLQHYLLFRQLIKT